MADLAVALLMPVGATPGAGKALAPAAKGDAAGAGDPFAALMASAAPAVAASPLAALIGTAVPGVSKPAVVTPVAVDTIVAPLATPRAAPSGPLAALVLPGPPTPVPAAEADAAVSDKLPADPDAHDKDADDATDSAALLALLTTTPASMPQPAMPIVTQSQRPQVATDNAAPVAGAPKIRVATPQAAAAPQPESADAPAKPAAQTTFSSISALVAMMTAQQAGTDDAAAPLQTATATMTTPDDLPAAARDIARTMTLPPMDVAAGVPAATAAAAPTPQIAPAAEAVQAETTVATSGQIAAPVMPRGVRMASPKLGKIDRPPLTRAQDAQPQTEVRETETVARASQHGAPRPVAERADVSGVAVAQQPASQGAGTTRFRADGVASTSELGSIDSVAQRHLAVAQDGQWLDSLAKDIAATGGSDSTLSFALSPEHLGGLKVDILQNEDGASVHLTTETDQARTILLDAQPRLAAEARAQGLNLRETSVSSNGSQPDAQRQTPSQGSAQQSNGQPGGQDRRGFQQAAPEPRRPTLSTASDPASDSDLYA